MTSTNLRDTTPGRTFTKQKVAVHTDSAGFLGRHPAFGLGLFLLGGLIFSVLAFNVRTNGPLLAWDLPIDQSLHARAIQDSWFVIELMRFSGELGKFAALIIAIPMLLYWLWKRHWNAICMLAIGVGGGSVWFLVLSTLMGRHRPIFPDPLEVPLPGPGFPSGHSIFSVLFYGLILYQLLPHLATRNWRILAGIDALLIVLLVGFSRIYMGEHYPTDVLAGYAFGLAWGALVYTSLALYRQHRSIQAIK
jgi:undecaprenyl-diphosphatase